MTNHPSRSAAAKFFRENIGALPETGTREQWLCVALLAYQNQNDIVDIGKRHTARSRRWAAIGDEATARSRTYAAAAASYAAAFDAVSYRFLAPVAAAAATAQQAGVADADNRALIGLRVKMGEWRVAAANLIGFASR